ncbi:MAG: lysoplasmalogenase [Pelagimonas sp.]|jgi:uncharacterized membrane protein YhhN|nr:lysoplasmalogenase [Pelagimonas sp.]
MIWLSAVSALAYGLMLVEAQPSLHRSIVKTLPVGLLSLAALWAGAWGVALALALCAAGDWFLSFDGEPAFLAGLIAFALGHVGFIVVKLPLWQDIPWGAIAALGAVAISTRFWLLPYTGKLKLPVAVYVVLISGMGVMAWAQEDWLIRLGATSFVLSDCLLALGLFRSAPHTSRPLWVFYWLGQAGLFLGLLSH